MLKRYEEPSRALWTGKAWEIRSALRALQRQKGGHTRVQELLPAGAGADAGTTRGESDGRARDIGSAPAQSRGRRSLR